MNAKAFNLKNAALVVAISVGLLFGVTHFSYAAPTVVPCPPGGYSSCSSERDSGGNVKEIRVLSTGSVQNGITIPAGSKEVVYSGADGTRQTGYYTAQNTKIPGSGQKCNSAGCVPADGVFDTLGTILFKTGGGLVGLYNNPDEIIPSIAGGLGLYGITYDLLMSALAAIAWAMFYLAQFVLWLAGTLLDVVIFHLVLNMGYYINGAGGEGIKIAWGILRNLVNVAIIAGLVAVGISTIVQYSTYNAKAFLSKLIIAALLVNFSYFFAGAMIDAANFVASNIFYSKIMPEDCAQVNRDALGKLAGAVATNFTGGVASGGGQKMCSIAGTILASVGLSTFNDIKNIVDKNSGKEKGTNADGKGKGIDAAFFLVYTMGAIFFFVTAFVFFATTVLLVGRFVALILLLVTSPIGIAGTEIPYVTTYAKNWWTELASQAIFAPLFILLIGISMTVMKKFIHVSSKVGAEEKFGQIASGDVKVFPLILSFFVAIAFMLASLSLARQMSKQTTYFKGIYESAAKAGGFVGRNTAGRVSNLGYQSTKGLENVPVLNQVPKLFKFGAEYNFGGTKGALKPEKINTFEDFAKQLARNQSKGEPAAPLASKGAPTTAPNASKGPANVTTLASTTNQNKKAPGDRLRDDLVRQNAENGIQRLSDASQSAGSVIAVYGTANDKGAHTADAVELHELVGEQKKQTLTAEQANRKAEAMKRIEEREKKVLESINENINALRENVRHSDSEIKRNESLIKNDPTNAAKYTTTIQTKMEEKRIAEGQLASATKAHDTLSSAARKRTKGIEQVESSHPSAQSGVRIQT